jgi:hypothetical protein
MYVAQYVFDKNGYDFTYKCASQNIGKNMFYHLKKTAPQDITLSTPIDLFLRLKRKSYKSD